MVTACKTALFARNRELFQSRYPVVWTYLESLNEPVSKLVMDGDTPVNIDLGETTLYPEPARDWTAEQVATYFDDPDRIGFSSPAHCNLSPISRRVLADVTDYFDEHHGGKLESYPVVDVGFAFVFGIGLGHHILDLVKRGLSRYMILIEPLPELLLQSMAAIDWGEIFDSAADRGMQIEFLLGKTPPDAIALIERYLFHKRQTFLDGSYAYMHYPSWPLRETRVLLNEKIKTFYLSWGFFEDEILMMSNAYHNLKRWDLALVSRRSYLEQKVPVFVVGSGPSLDDALPVIQKWQDRAIVFSCGTAIGILRKNGITPDFHVENENTLPLVDNLRDFHGEYGFEGTTLIASATVPPEVGSFFDKRWFYHRAFLSSSHLLKGDLVPLAGCSPLVANAAFAVMATMGFKEIYLFGVDCGRREDAGHHAGDAVYYDEEYDNYLPGEGLDLLETEFTREVPANFGGTALTTWYLDMSRSAFTGMLNVVPDVTLYNCSDGARIDGAQARHAASVRLSSTPDDVARAKTRLENQLPHFEAAAFLDTLDLKALAEGCEAFPDALNAAMDRLLEDNAGFWEMEQEVRQLLEQDDSPFEAVRRIAEGTMTSLIRLGAFGGTRISDTEGRRAFFRYYVEKYRETCLWMADEAEALMREIAEGRPQLSAFVSPEGEKE